MRYQPIGEFRICERPVAQGVLRPVARECETRLLADISADMAFYRQIKYLSADIRHIYRYAGMEKFSRYLSADISAGISADSIGRLDYRSYST